MILAGMGLFMNLQNKRIDDLRSDLKDGLGKLDAKVDRLA